jgi:hypothetical protein
MSLGDPFSGIVFEPVPAHVERPAWIPISRADFSSIMSVKPGGLQDEQSQFTCDCCLPRQALGFGINSFSKVKSKDK